jgi:hypothetical protein
MSWFAPGGDERVINFTCTEVSPKYQAKVEVFCDLVDPSTECGWRGQTPTNLDK